MNRALPIHLAPTGDVADRTSPLGNPKLEFLPAHREQIEAELRGMIGMWKEKEMPLDNKVRHPFSEWARTIGGILKASGFEHFLANFVRCSAGRPTTRSARRLEPAGSRPAGQVGLRSAEVGSRLAVDVGVGRAGFISGLVP